MSLNWNCKPLTDRGINIWTTKPDVADDDQVLNPITESLIWASITVGCDGRKIDTFIQRIREYEIACGPLLHWPEAGYEEQAIAANFIRPDSRHPKGYLSAAELRRHEGFSTNASALTDAQWAKKLAQIISEKASGSLHRELKRPR